MPSVATGRRGFKPRLRGLFCTGKHGFQRCYGVGSALVGTVFNAAYGVCSALVCAVFNAAYGLVLRPSYCI